MELTVMSGAGNLFAVVGGELGELAASAGALARELCAAGAVLDGERLDGLLLVTRASERERADCRMEVFNADGSRAESCGNGLRCAAMFARERGLAPADRMRVATDAGVRDVELFRDRGRIVAARASMGVPRLIAVEEQLATRSGPQVATIVDMGNPHCVVFVEDVRAAPVGELGPEIERLPRFPARTNVEFCAPRGGRLALRVWERGVGETRACGSGACAAAVAAAVGRGAALPIEVDLPGGTLAVEWDGRGEARLRGPCEERWRGRRA